jgi:hypothetical protein
MSPRAIHSALFILWCVAVSTLYILVPFFDHVIFLAVSVLIAVALFMHAVPEFLIYQYSFPTYLESISSNPTAIRIFVWMSVGSTSLLAATTFLYLVGPTATGEPTAVWSQDFVTRLGSWLAVWWTWQFYAGAISLSLAKKFGRSTVTTAPQFRNPIHRAVSRRGSIMRIPRTTSFKCLASHPAQASASDSQPPSSLV